MLITSFLTASIILSALFLVLLIILHFLKPEFSPLWRMISEYEIGRFGWMMRLAFVCWGASLLALILVLWPALLTPGGMIGGWWFLVLVVVLFGAAAFKPNPITENNPNLTNTIHTICGAVTILTFPIAATLVGNSLRHNTAWAGSVTALTIATVLVWAGMVAYFASIILSRAMNPKAGRNGPEIYQGWPNRFMVLTYIAWILIIGIFAFSSIS